MYSLECLVGGVDSLYNLSRLIYDPEKSGGPVAVVYQAIVDGPAILARAPDLIFAVKFAFHSLLDSRNHRILFVGGRERENAGVCAESEIGVIENVRRNDTADIVILIGGHPGGNQPERQTAIAIARAQRHPT